MVRLFTHNRRLAYGHSYVAYAPSDVGVPVSEPTISRADDLDRIARISTKNGIYLFVTISPYT
jgi:hypothetical protein